MFSCEQEPFHDGDQVQMGSGALECVVSLSRLCTRNYILSHHLWLLSTNQTWQPILPHDGIYLLTTLATTRASSVPKYSVPMYEYRRRIRASAQEVTVFYVPVLVLSLYHAAMFQSSISLQLSNVAVGLAWYFVKGHEIVFFNSNSQWITWYQHETNSWFSSIIVPPGFLLSSGFLTIYF